MDAQILVWWQSKTRIKHNVLTNYMYMDQRPNKQIKSKQHALQALAETGTELIVPRPKKHAHLGEKPRFW